MTITTPDLNPTARRLTQLAQLYQASQASQLLDRTLDKALDYEAEVCRGQLQQVQSDLAELERQYQLSSDEFYRRYQTGQTDDRLDFVEWASLVQMRTNLQERLRLLTGNDRP